MYDTKRLDASRSQWSTDSHKCILAPLANMQLECTYCYATFRDIDNVLSLEQGIEFKHIKTRPEMKK